MLGIVVAAADAYYAEDADDAVVLRGFRYKSIDACSDRKKASFRPSERDWYEVDVDVDVFADAVVVAVDECSNKWWDFLGMY